MTEFPDFSELKFEEKRHVYRLNGIMIPSVTTIMKPLSQTLYKGVDEDMLSKAAHKGTVVHNAIENYFLYGVEDIDMTYWLFFKAFMDWVKDYNPEPLHNEFAVYHKALRYAGTVDMIAEVDGKVTLIDFKTSVAVNKMLTSVQLEAYEKALASHGVHVEEKAILHLKSNGLYEWVVHELNDNEAWETFGALLTVNNHIKKYKERR